MNQGKPAKTFGLTHTQARYLRAVFEAALASRAAPRWLSAAECEVVAALVALNLLSEDGRLTMMGLAVAANLPKAQLGSLCLAA